MPGASIQPTQAYRRLTYIKPAPVFIDNFIGNQVSLQVYLRNYLLLKLQRIGRYSYLGFPYYCSLLLQATQVPSVIKWRVFFQTKYARAFSFFIDRKEGQLELPNLTVIKQVVYSTFQSAQVANFLGIPAHPQIGLYLLYSYKFRPIRQSSTSWLILNTQNWQTIIGIYHNTLYRGYYHVPTRTYSKIPRMLSIYTAKKYVKNDCAVSIHIKRSPNITIRYK